RSDPAAVSRTAGTSVVGRDSERRDCLVMRRKKRTSQSEKFRPITSKLCSLRSRRVFPSLAGADATRTRTPAHLPPTPHTPGKAKRDRGDGKPSHGLARIFLPADP